MKTLEAFSASSTVSIWVRGGIKSEARLRNRSESVGFSSGRNVPSTNIIRYVEKEWYVT
jgi:hypothetical protein